MPRKKLEEPIVEKKILEILNSTRRGMSITEVTKKLDNLHGIKRSPQVIKRYLYKLEEEGKIRREDG